MTLLRDPSRLKDLDRSESQSDLTLVCQDGVTFGHQALLANQSTFLKDLFFSSSPLRNISLLEVPGLPSKLKPEHYSVPLTIHLPDFSIEVVEAFMRSLYRGATKLKQQDFPKL